MNYADGRVVLAMEGGYDLEAISESAEECVKAGFSYILIIPTFGQNLPLLLRCRRAAPIAVLLRAILNTSGQADSTFYCRDIIEHGATNRLLSLLRANKVLLRLLPLNQYDEVSRWISLRTISKNEC